MATSSSSLNATLKNAQTQFGIPDLDIETILGLAVERGAALAELFFEDSESTRLTYENGEVESVIDGRDRGCGLRILFDNRSVYGYTTSLNQESLEQLATSLAAATEGAKKGTVARDWRESRQKISEIADYRISLNPRLLPMVEKVKIAQRIDASARRILPDARQVTALVLDKVRKILILNSDGLLARDEKTYFHMVCQIVAEKGGKVESAYSTDGGFAGAELLEKIPPEEIGEKAATRVKILLEAKPAPSGSMAVVMAAEAGGTMVHEAVGHGLEADLACQGLSVYEGKVGQQVASPLITVIDDGSIPALRGSQAYDDEGTPSQKNVLIENGILKGYLVDKLSAMKFDLPATGNGRRETFRSKPIVRMTNTYIERGKDDPAKILADTKSGIYVKAMGGGQVNTVTGDFVFAVTEGYLIHDGKLGAPIRGATLVGNGPQILSIVDRVGTDLGYITGTCGKDGQGAPVTDAQPTIRIPKMTVGGEVPMTDYWAAEVT